MGRKGKGRERETPDEEVGTPNLKKQKKDAHKSPANPIKSDSTFRKSFYQEVSPLKNFSQEEVESFRKEHKITINGFDYKPVRTFQETGLPDEMLVTCRNFEKPTPIQSQCWPIILSGHDVVGIAETGSGKTMAFTLPALVHIKDQPPLSKKQGPIVLILAPTRELASQIAEVTEEAGQVCGLRSTCIYGGVDKGPQKESLEKGSHFVIATPGRLLDLVNQGICNLNRVTYLVMDEADRMLDMGFEKDIRAIVSHLQKDRQTLMFSATWPQVIQKMAEDYLINPVKVTIGSEDLSANHRVKQIVEVIEPFEKDARLDQLLKQYHKSRNNRVLIFVLYKKEAVRVEQMLNRKGWKVQAIHGDINQHLRTKAMNNFKDGSQPLLVATDVAARGLDIPNVEYVINFTFPLTIEDYIHRIGRTGRAGKTGISHTLFTSYDKAKTGELVRVLREANQDVPETLLKFGCATKKKEHAMYGNAFKTVNPNALPMPKTTHIKFDD